LKIQLIVLQITTYAIYNLEIMIYASVSQTVVHSGMSGGSLAVLEENSLQILYQTPNE
jgi:hypothetical protein